MESEIVGQKGSEKGVVQFVDIRKSHLAVITALFTILFLVLNWIVNYVEKATAAPNNGEASVTQILNNQTAILGRLESSVNATHEILTQRTGTLTETRDASKASNQMLASMSTAMDRQSSVLVEQTKVLQKLSIWLDIQIQKGK